MAANSGSKHRAGPDVMAKALAEFSTGDISAALLKLHIPHGGFLGGLTMWSPQRQDGSTRVVGPVYTVKFVRNSVHNAPRLDGHYADGIPNGSVLFISAPPRIVNAAYSGTISERAKFSGAVGAVVDGRVKDLQDHRALGFPVFARDTSTASPEEILRASEVDVPVRLHSDEQDTVIRPGDYIVGDLNGVVCIPRSLTEQVLELVKEELTTRALVTKALREGKSYTEAVREGDIPRGGKHGAN